MKCGQKSEGVAALFGRLNYIATKHIRENGILYIFLLFLFFLGISLGAYWVNNLSVESKDLLTRYLNGFFSLIPESILNKGKLFKTSFINNMVSAALLLIFGFTYLGIGFSSLYITFKGFCFGFSVAFLVEGFGRKGLIFSLISLLPHSIVLIPGILVLCSVSLQYSLFLLKSRKERRYESNRQYLINYLFSYTFGLTLLIMSIVIESYITPIIIKSLSSLLK